MSYITTHHQFVIDEKHPKDVFDEMSNFFSLYTVTLDSFHQLSIGLTVPADFDIANNAKLNTHYQNLIKAVRYSIPDVNVIPLQIAEDNGQLGAGMLELMIQYHEGRIIQPEAAAQPTFYQKILGVMLPRFDSTREQEGLYPPPSQRPEPVVPVNAQPVPAPATAKSIPVGTQQSIPPQYQPPQNPLAAQPQVIPNIPPVVTPPQPVIPQPAYQPPVIQPQSAPINYLPKPNVNIKPYRELLTQAILEQATHDKSTNPTNQPISEIVLKSKDSLTAAMIETLFASFQPNNNAPRAYDAIDLASYGLEELRPKLRQIGVTITDEAQFSLNAKAKATAQDLEKIRQGMANSADIHLATQLNYGSITTSPNVNPAVNIPSSSNQADATQTPTPNSQATAAHPANANHLNIAINIKVNDSMGERTVKVREFPVAFSTQNTTSQPAKLVKIMTKQVAGEAFYLAEQDGQLLAKNVAHSITLQRNGQASNLRENDILLPNDVLQIDSEVQISLLLN